MARWRVNIIRKRAEHLGTVDAVLGLMGSQQIQEEDAMAKRQAESVYRIVDVVGESSTSWEDAGRRAVETAATSIRDLRLAEVVKMD